MITNQVSNAGRDPFAQGISGEEIILQRTGSTVNKVRLKSLANNGSSVKVLTLDTESLELAWAPVLSVSKTEDSNSRMELVTRCRRRAILTATHSCLTVNNDGRIVKVKTENLVPGRSLVPVAGKMPGPFARRLVVDSAELTTSLGRKCKYKLDGFPLIEDMGFLVGRYLKDGYSDRGFSIDLPIVSEEVQSRVVKMLEQLSLNPLVRSRMLRICSRQFARYFSSQFGSKSVEKKIPGWVFGTSDKFRRGVVDGFWSGCWISPDGMQMRTQTDSREIALDLQALLTTLGIQASCRLWHSKPRHNLNNTHYWIELAASSIGRMPKLTNPVKRERQSRWKMPQKDMLCVLPIPRNLVKYRLRLKSAKGYGGFSFVNREAFHHQHRKLIDGPLLWDVIKSVQRVPARDVMYNLVTEGDNEIVLYSGLTISSGYNGQNGY